MYEQDVIERIQTFSILSVAYKWLGGVTKVIACDHQSERSLLLKLKKLLNEADVVIAHNGDAFDIRKINARFIVHKISPPSQYRTIDTKKEAKKIAYFDSNSLNNLGIDMGEGEKMKHRGFDMWKGAMNGVQKDWDDMKRYNKRDVDLLERVYLRLRPWIATRQSRSDGKQCPKCHSDNVQFSGYIKTLTTRLRRVRCMACGGWSTAKSTE